MSEEEKPLEFSARDLMPDWAQEKPSEPQKDYAKRYAEDDDRRDRRGGGGRRDDRRGGGGFGGGGGARRDDRRGGFGGRGGEHRGEGGPRGPRPDRGGDRPRGDRREGDRRGGGDRRHGDRERNDRPREAQPAAGVVATLEPSGPAVEGLTRHIRETFRSFPVADLAKMILEARERYRIRFTATEPVRLNQCLLDGSLWLSREEAILHLLSGPALDHYYLAEDIEIDPPAGNFAVIAVCGMSGVILGPPNHHEYQRNIARLHRERFSDMPIERFKSRIRMESGEEILEKWKEQVSRVRQYRVKPLDQPSAVEEETVPVAEETPAEEVAATDPEITAEETAPEVADEPAAEEIEAETEAVAESESEAADEETSEPASPAPAEKTDDGPVFKSLEEVSRHFREHFAGPIIVETSVAVVPGNIAGRLLSPGLLVHLRQETEKLRRGFPLAMIQSLCGEFERKGLKFFKRGKKSLHVSAVRPKPIDEGANFTESIQAIVEFVKTAPKPNVASLLEALVPGFKKPEGPAIEESPEWSDAARTVLKDLRWLTAEGYLLEFADTGLALGRQPQEASAAPAEAKAPKEKGAKPAKAKKDGGKPKAEAAVPAEATVEEAMVEAPVSEEAAEVVSESISEEVAEPASEEVSETISEDVSEPASEPVVDLETAPEELAESVADLSHEDESEPDEPRDGADPVATA